MWFNKLVSFQYTKTKKYWKLKVFILHFTCKYPSAFDGIYIFVNGKYLEENIRLNSKFQ